MHYANVYGHSPHADSEINYRDEMVRFFCDPEYYQQCYDNANGEGFPDEEPDYDYYGAIDYVMAEMSSVLGHDENEEYSWVAVVSSVGFAAI